MASRNGRSSPKTKGQQPSRESSRRERQPKKEAKRAAREVGQTEQPDKSAARLADKRARVRPRERAEHLQAQAHQTFLRELPELLQHHSGEWVVYRGKMQLALGAGKTALMQKCLRGGLDPRELMVRRIHPGAEEPPSLFVQGTV